MLRPLSVTEAGWLLVVGTTEVDCQLINEALKVLAAPSTSDDQPTLTGFQHSWNDRPISQTLIIYFRHCLCSFCKLCVCVCVCVCVNVCARACVCVFSHSISCLHSTVWLCSCQHYFKSCMLHLIVIFILMYSVVVVQRFAPQCRPFISFLYYCCNHY